MPNIFISYSHKDRDFVRSLHDRLKADNYDIWVDFEDIPLSAEWWLEIKAGIDSADNFFFVITPDSVQSKVCNQEIQYALDNNKRIVPLLQTLIKDPDISAQMRPEIEKINWVRFDDPDTFDENYIKLRSILESGLEHIQEHTRLLIRAREWENNGKKRAYLLDQRNLRLARQWLDQAQGKEPAPTALHQAYIDASSKALRRLRNLRSVLSVVAIVLVGVLALFTFRSILLSPYQQKIDLLMNRQSSFRVMRSPGLIDLAIDEGTAGNTYTNLDDMNPYVLHATLSVYDPDFFTRSNVDATKSLFDLLHVVINGVPQPSSISPMALLLTQNRILDAEFLSERDMIRYAEEQVVSTEIDRNYASRDVLEIFLNDLYFGNQTYGIGAASQWYFNTDPSNLDIAQVAFLIGISVNPPRYDPTIDTDAAIDQMDTTLSRMFEVGCLDLADLLIREPVCINQDTTVLLDDQPQALFTSTGNTDDSTILRIRDEIIDRQYEGQSVALAAPHFVNLIEQELYDLFGNQSFYNEALRIETAFDAELQAKAESIIRETVDSYAENGIDNAAFIATRPDDGSLIALVGSVDPTNAQTGNAALDFRFAGSVMHPVTYLATLSLDEEGAAWFPGTIVWDVPASYEIGSSVYMPTNLDGLYRGPVPLRFALANSLNVPTVSSLMHVGFDRFAETVDAIGFQFGPDEPVSLASAVGANSVRLIDIATAYGTLANGGSIARPHAIVRIIDRDGQEIYVADEPSEVTVSPENAFLVTSMLSDADAAQSFYGDYRANLGPEFLSGDVAIIPGFTDLAFSGSLWAVGYTPDMVGALWMGNFKNNRIFNVTALDAVGEWGEIMRVALNSAPRPFEMPDGITTYTICPEDGTLYEDTCPSPGVTEFARKDQPPPVSGRGELLTLLIDSWTGKQANQYCPDHMLTATFLTTEDPFALQWVQSVAGQAWARRVNLTLPLQSAPTASCQPGDPVPVVRINSPQEGETIQAIASIVGTASGPDFESYQLLLAPAGSSDFVMISPEITQALPSSGSELHTWDTRMVPNGEYILRLQAVSTTGGFIYVDRTITVGNS